MRNRVASVVASKKNAPEVNADKTKYVVEIFKYLGTTLTHNVLLRKKLRAD